MEKEEFLKNIGIVFDELKKIREECEDKDTEPYLGKYDSFTIQTNNYDAEFDKEFVFSIMPGGHLVVFNKKTKEIKSVFRDWEYITIDNKD